MKSREEFPGEHTREWSSTRRSNPSDKTSKKSWNPPKLLIHVLIQICKLH